MRCVWLDIFYLMNSQFLRTSCRLSHLRARRAIIAKLVECIDFPENRARILVDDATPLLFLSKHYLLLLARPVIKHGDKVSNDKHRASGVKLVDDSEHRLQ